VGQQVAIEDQGPDPVDLEQVRGHLPAGVDAADAYDLAPLQKGLLFHSLMGSAEERPYHNQMSWELEGELDVEAYRRAWEGAVEANAVLRSGVQWEGLEKPLQVVWREVELPFEVEDLSGLGADQQRGRLEEYLAEDLRRGFELDRPPLLRLVVFRLEERKWELVWSFQHLILDGWSVSLLLEEVSRRYEAARLGTPTQEEERRPYRDYIGWLQGQDLEGAEGYWRELLAGIEEPTPLPRERTEESGYGEVWRQLDKEEVERLKQLARGARVTLSTVVAGAWGLLLSRYSGEEEVVFGVTSSGRPGELKGVEEMVGLFINTLPVRMRAMPERRVGEWLGELQEQQVRSRQYEYSPLAKVQSWSQVPAGQPLFESIVVYENYPVQGSLARIGDESRVLAIKWVERTNYPLTLVVAAEKDLRLGLDYQRGEFSQAQVEGMLGDLTRLLGQLAEGGERRLREISLLSDDERRRVLVEWNRTEVAYPADKTVHELFEAQVERTPEAVALVYEGEELSYRELNRRGNRLAHRLRELGVGPEVLVGICAERSIGMVVGLLGILKAGGAYLPLDPSYPQERLEFMLEDTQAPVLLSQQQLLVHLPSHERVVLLEDGWVGYPEENPAPLAQAQNLAYVIYTSGSTGRPKGVMIEHRNLCNFVQFMSVELLDIRDRVAWVTSFGFDIAFLEWFGPLATGAKVVISPYGGSSGEELASWASEQGVTLIQGTPSMWRILSESPVNGLVEKALVGGEALPASLAQQVAGLGSRVTNLYGPTETTIWSTWAVLDFQAKSDSPPIGKPIQNTQVYVLDRWGEPVPVGVAGELYIGGAGVARGYWKRPELTRERFVENRFGQGRLYRTGDQVRWRGDGKLEFLGRRDEQVKIRGYRIELGEIEASLLEQAGVKEAVVVAREEVAGQKRLVAYVVGQAGSELDFEGLKSELKRRLPEYMVPPAWVELESLPLTPNGKLDRRSLPEPEWRESGYEAPRSHVEAELCRIWGEVLGIERVGIQDNFFELGGDSILSIKVVSRAREAGLGLRPGDLFARRTVAELVKAVGQQLEASAEFRPVSAPEDVLDRIRVRHLGRHFDDGPALN